MQDASTPPDHDKHSDSIGSAEDFQLADLAAFEQRTGRADGAEAATRAPAAPDWLVEVDDTDYLAPAASTRRRAGSGGASADDDGTALDADDINADELDDDTTYVREPEEPVRLQKVLAAAGVGSRRKCEQMIVEGRVEVDGVVVRELGSRVRPDSAVIRVDGERLNLRSDMVYLAFNKPRGVLSTMADDKGRESIGTYVVDRERLFHVGRLDADSEGLILLTNDGELAHRLTHPRYGVQKTYLAQVAAPVPRNLGRALLRGIELDDGLAKADDYQLLDVSGGRALIQIVLHEGRKHIVRRMLATAGFPVQQLVRTAHGPITLGHLRSGAVRKLSRSELGALYRLVGL